MLQRRLRTLPAARAADRRELAAATRNPAHGYGVA
jgi:hypothetical protein